MLFYIQFSSPTRYKRVTVPSPLAARQTYAELAPWVVSESVTRLKHLKGGTQPSNYLFCYNNDKWVVTMMIAGDQSLMIVELLSRGQTP